MAEYRLVATWRLDAPLEAVYAAVCDPIRWPQWWPDAQAIEERRPGADDGVGRLLRCVWRSSLPYRLRFDLLTTHMEPLVVVEGRVTGDLEGVGRCHFSEADGLTTVRHEWHVHTMRPWMDMLSPCTDIAFKHNHALAMKRGGEGLASQLGVRLLDFGHEDLLAEPGACRHEVAKAVGAGIVAGIVATLLQACIWWFSGVAVLDTFSRDVLLTSAILMGPGMLAPLDAVPWSPVVVAACIHLVLSVGYGLLMTPIIRDLPLGKGLLAGAAFGLVLYAVNLHGFTTVFPWFAVARGWDTAIIHVAFGMALAGSYRLLRWHYR
jgi:uncharacterized protein YndB with AHSA1/START domain